MKTIANALLNVLASERIVGLGMAVAMGVCFGSALIRNL